MKKKILAFVSVFTMLLPFISHGQSPTKELTKNSKWKSTVVTVVWGNANKECSGFGICNMETVSQASFNPKIETTATLCANGKEELLLIVEKDDLRKLLNRDIYDRLADKRSARFESEVVIPLEVTRKLGMRAAVTLPAGHYSLSHSNGEVLVSFPISNNERNK